MFRTLIERPWEKIKEIPEANPYFGYEDFMKKKVKSKKQEDKSDG